MPRRLLERDPGLPSETGATGPTREPGGSDQPLRGLRLVVTDLDLQQREHRGIAMFSKALLRALRRSGAEVWLLTDFDPPLRDPGLRTLPQSARDLIYASRVLEGLTVGHRGARSPLESAVRGPSRLLLKLWKLKQMVRESVLSLLPRRYHFDRLPQVRLHGLFDNPYYRQERLRYLEDVDGILCGRYLYLKSMRRALTRRPRPLPVTIGSFDGLITTCPLNLTTTDPGIFVQTVHDLIPLEYVPTSDHVGNFGQRLASCQAAGKLFVSASTRRKFEQALPHAGDRGGRVIIQPPSLQLPSGSLQELFAQPVLRPSRRARARHGELQPFRYLLFNSSVEPRKNLLFAIQAFRLSGLGEQGIRLCVTGQLKRDDYSRAVGEQADDAVLLTSYIDESTKATLFLHALAILSPSLVEGFGIPVLDGACLGTPVLASPSESHVEIRGLHDFRELIWLCDPTDPIAWAHAMKRLATAERSRITDVDEERQRRLERYGARSAAVTEEFRRSVCAQILDSQR